VPKHHAILDLGTKRSWVASFTHRQCYSREVRVRYPLGRKLGAPRSWSGRDGDDKRCCLWQGSNLSQSTDYVISDHT